MPDILFLLKQPAAYLLPSEALGRMFAVLEHIQQEANRGINATIKDKYFNAAASTPSHIFPVLINLAQKHLRKLPPYRKILKYFIMRPHNLQSIVMRRNIFQHISERIHIKKSYSRLTDVPQL